jgi:hypothetical protein
MAYGKKEFDFANHPWESFVFFDIETVSRVPELQEETPLYDSFLYKMRYAEEAQRKDFSAYNLKALYAQKAALYPEFGKIVCISVGRIINDEIVIYTFKDEEEAVLLTRFNKRLEQWDIAERESGKQLALCGVNIKFFDLRYIYIRSVVNGVKPVKGHIDLTGLKPWEVFTADLTDYWKQTSPYNAPLMCITEVLGLPSPKQDIDGSQTSEVYWKEGSAGLDRIAKYCEGDVEAVVNIARRLRFDPTLPRKAEDQQTPGQEEPQEPEPPKLNVFQKIYHTNALDSKLEAELLELIKGKRLTKADKENLRIILQGALLRTDFVSGDQDNKAVKEEKLAAIEELINKLNGKK